MTAPKAEKTLTLCGHRILGDGFGGWICNEQGVITGKDGSQRTDTVRTTYHATMLQCCKHIANVRAAECDDVDRVVLAWDRLVKQLRELT